MARAQACHKICVRALQKNAKRKCVSVVLRRHGQTKGSKISQERRWSRSSPHTGCRIGPGSFPSRLSVINRKLRAAVVLKHSPPARQPPPHILPTPPLPNLEVSIAFCVNIDMQGCSVCSHCWAVHTGTMLQQRRHCSLYMLAKEQKCAATVSVCTFLQEVLKLRCRFLY